MGDQYATLFKGGIIVYPSKRESGKTIKCWFALSHRGKMRVVIKMVRLLIVMKLGKNAAEANAHR